MKSKLLGAVIAALVLTVSPAVACEGASVLFQDDFSFADPAWGSFEGTTIGGGTLNISVQPAGGYTLLNQASLYGDFDACIDVVQHNDDPDGGWGSLVFWGLDYENFYALDVTTSGYVKVSRLQSNRWLSPVDWTLTEGVINPGTATNTLRVVAQGNVATVYVNGSQVAQFRGQPPDGGGLIGVYGAAPNGSAATVDFSNFVVTSADGAATGPATGPTGDPGAAAPAPGTKQKN